MDPIRFTNNPSGELIEETAYTPEGAIPYRGFAPNPLPPVLSIDWKLAQILSEADRSLSKLAGLGINLPNPHLLSQAFIRREAVLSSRIEGTQTTIADLYAFEAGQLQLPGLGPDISARPPQSDVREVQNYVRALELGLDWVTEKGAPVNLWLLRELHKVLLEGVRGDRAHPGEFRQIQNIIGSDIPMSIREKFDTARFIPPPVAQMQDALNALEKYITEEDTSHSYPPLIKLALLHYQFETIHPFEDGNGRIGRLLISLLLVAWGILPIPLFNLSAYFERSRTEYCDLLLKVSENSRWDSWLEFFLTGIAEESKNASKLATELLNLLSDIRNKLHNVRISGLLSGVAEYTFERPILTAVDVQTKFSVSHPTAINALRRLEDMEFLQDITRGERYKIFIAHDIIRILG